MTSVLGELRSFGISFAAAAISYLLNASYPQRILASTGVPFAAWGILSGFTCVLWISLAREVGGRGCGVLTAILTAALILLGGSWFGVVYPPWIGAVGIASFAAMGLATEFVSGGLGSVLGLAINWLWLGAVFDAWPRSIIFTILIAIASFASGEAGSRLGKLFGEKLQKLVTPQSFNAAEK